MENGWLGGNLSMASIVFPSATNCMKRSSATVFLSRLVLELSVRLASWRNTQLYSIGMDAVTYVHTALRAHAH